MMYLPAVLAVIIAGLLAPRFKRAPSLAMAVMIVLLIVPMTYVVHGTQQIVSKLSLSSVMTDYGAVLSMLVTEPVKAYKKEPSNGLFCLLALGIASFLLLGIGQLVSSRPKTTPSHADE
jgi:hypothetical protein